MSSAGGKGRSGRGAGGRPRAVTVATPEYRRLAERLQAHRRALGYGAESCRLYYLQASEVLAFLERERGVREVAAVAVADVEAYYRYIGVRPGHNGTAALATASQGSLVRVCRDLFGMLVQAGELAVDPSIGAGWSAGREAAGERVRLSQAEVAELYAATADAREQALVSLAYGCGLRAGEIEALDVADMQLGEGLVIVRSGKGGRRRAVPMGEGVARDVTAYLRGDRTWWTSFGESRAQTQPSLSTTALLVNDHGRWMRTYTLNKVLRALGERAGLADEDGCEKCVTCHVLRHAIATHLLERGMATELVRQFLGHAHLATTQVYTHVSQALINELTA